MSTTDPQRPDDATTTTDEPTPSGPTAAGPTTSSPTTSGPAHEVRAPRVRTVVWGLVLAVLGAGVLGRAAGRHLDVDVAAIVLVAAAGLALLVGSIGSSLRRHR